jgi:predicted Zn-dependent protease with MMP-like domain
MTPEEFEQLVNAGIEAIPKKFLDLLDNVAVVIEDYPSPEQMQKLQLKPGWTLFGLYEGVPKTKRGNPYVVIMPDKITIFRGPILQAAQEPEAIKELVKKTVWHEIAHHFGLDHDGISRAEKNRP